MASLTLLLGGGSAAPSWAVCRVDGRGAWAAHSNTQHHTWPLAWALVLGASASPALPARARARVRVPRGGSQPPGSELAPPTLGGSHTGRPALRLAARGAPRCGWPPLGVPRCGWPFGASRAAAGPLSARTPGPPAAGQPGWCRLAGRPAPRPRRPRPRASPLTAPSLWRCAARRVRGRRGSGGGQQEQGRRQPASWLAAAASGEGAARRLGAGGADGGRRQG